MSGYGEVVRETAAQAHERRIQAIEAVLVKWNPPVDLSPKFLRMLALECLAAVEAGF